MKLPGISVGQTGRYHARNLPKVDYMGPARALQGAAKAISQFMDVDDDVSTATAEAAKELARLRAKLEDNITIPVEEIPEGIEYNNIKTVLGDDGEEIEVEMPIVFTHQIADRMWDQQSQAIIDRYSGQIKSDEARNKFINEITERYVAPGTLAISGRAATNRREHNWATSLDNINDILSSNAPSNVREEQALEILSRQLILGASPAMVTQQRQSIRPRIDYIDATNSLKSAGSVDEIDQLESEIWEGGNSLSPDSRRQLSVEADKRRADFEKEEQERKIQNEEHLTELLIRGDLTTGTVADWLSRDDISQEVARTLNNGLQSSSGGGAPKATDPFVLSYWRKHIVGLPYVADTGITVSEKADAMKRAIRHASMGLTMAGEPSPTGPTISGQDSLTLMKDIDAAVKRATETPAYNDAWEQIRVYTRAYDPLTGALSGNQAQIDSAIAFKQALDTYMQQYGIDADPIEFFRTNKDYFNPDIMEDGINQAFYDKFAEVRMFMDVEAGEVTGFNKQQQDQFIQWLRKAVQDQSLSRDEANEMAAYFMMYYRGQGIAPADTMSYDGPLYEVQR